MCQKEFLKEHLCALKVFLCALVSRPVCTRTHAQLRGNIGHNYHCFLQVITVCPLGNIERALKDTE